MLLGPVVVLPPASSPINVEPEAVVIASPALLPKIVLLLMPILIWVPSTLPKLPVLTLLPLIKLVEPLKAEVNTCDLKEAVTAELADAHRNATKPRLVIP